MPEYQEVASVEVPRVERVEPEPMREPPEVWVKVKREGEGLRVLEASHEVPMLTEVIPHLEVSAGVKRQLERWQRTTYAPTIEHAMQRAPGKEIGARIWADAIGAAICQQLRERDGVEFHSTVMQEPAYLAMGGSLFQLSPVAIKRTSSALAAARARLAVQARVEAERIVAEGRANADALVGAANAKVAEAEKLLERAKGGVPMAQWARENRVPAKWTGVGWEYCMDLRVRLTGFDVQFISRGGRELTYSWEAKDCVPVKTKVWVGIGEQGDYVQTRINVDKMCPQLPHISHYAACWSAGDAPMVIRGIDDWRLLGAVLERCMGRVQLDSLRTPWTEWRDAFDATVPDELKKWINAGRSPRDLARQLHDRAESTAQAEHVSTESAEEGDSIWTA